MASGSFGLSTSNGYIVGTCYWDSVANVNNNTSNVNMHLHFSRTNDYTTWGHGGFWIQADGQQWSNELDFSVTLNSNTVVVEYNFTIGHNADGTKSINLQAGGSSDVFSVNTSSVDVVLDTIPRASNVSVSSTDCELGSTVRIFTNRLSTNFTHSITLAHGSANDLIFSGITDWVDYTLPYDLATMMPKSNAGAIAFVLDTYNGSTLVGTTIQFVRVTLPQNGSTKPYNLATTLTDPQGYKATYGSYIQTKSKVRAVSLASARYGATITGYSISVGGIVMAGADVTSAVCPTAGTIAVTTTVTDSRGFTNTLSQNITVLAYVAPTITAFSASRCLSNGVLDDTGGYAKVTMTASVKTFGISTDNVKGFSLYVKASTDTSYPTSATYTYNSAYALNTVQQITVSTEKAFDLKFIVTDAFGSAESTMRLSTAFSTMDFRTGGKGVAFGKVATQDGFEIDINVLPIYLSGTPLKTFLLNIFFPVGYIYESTVNVSPATTLGGTWTPIHNVFLLAEGTHTAGSTGGTENHTLTVTEMPAHGHNINASVDAGYYPWFGGLSAHGTQNGGLNYSGAVAQSGGNAAHNNMPPFKAVYMWERTS